MELCSGVWAPRRDNNRCEVVAVGSQARESWGWAGSSGELGGHLRDMEPAPQGSGPPGRQPSEKKSPGKAEQHISWK